MPTKSEKNKYADELIKATQYLIDLIDSAAANPEWNDSKFKAWNDLQESAKKKVKSSIDLSIRANDM